MSCPLPKDIIKKELNTSILFIDEICGGISKQVYKITTKNDKFILYIWLRPYEGKMTENQTKGMEYLFPDGYKYFIHNIKLLNDIKVRVPYIVSAGHYDEGGFDYAIVECFKGHSLDEYIKNGGDVRSIADKIAEATNKMAAKKRDFYGSPVESEPNNISAAQLVFNFYTEELNIASKIDNKVAALQFKLIHLMRQKMSEIYEKQTQKFSLVHGELTPPHVFILNNGDIGFIDIEGIKYFDIEYDWAVINNIYGNKIILPANVDFKKLEFYKICLKIGYVSGTTDYLVHIDSNNEMLKNIRENNLRDLEAML